MVSYGYHLVLSCQPATMRVVEHTPPRPPYITLPLKKINISADATPTPSKIRSFIFSLSVYIYINMSLCQHLLFCIIKNSYGASIPEEELAKVGIFLDIIT